jgi:hypothetical protein
MCGRQGVQVAGKLFPVRKTRDAATEWRMGMQHVELTFHGSCVFPVGSVRFYWTSVGWLDSCRSKLYSAEAATCAQVYAMECDVSRVTLGKSKSKTKVRGTCRLR